MKKINIWFADLTHTAQGISAATFPLGEWIIQVDHRLLADHKLVK